MKLLLIGYVYPPGGGVGMFKIAKFSKYLSKFGHDVTVLTLNRDLQPRPHNDQFAEVLEYPETIVRTSYRGKWINIPYDDGIRWIPDLTYHTQRLLRNNSFDAIFQTATPHLPLINVYLSDAFSDTIKIIDLRDAWTTSSKYDNWRNKSYLKKHKWWQMISKYLEPRVFNSCDIIITNTETMAEEYKKKYPEFKDRFDYINNGFDPCDYPDKCFSQRINNSNSLTIVYPGKFRNGINYFVEALAKSIKQGKEIEFIHFGDKNHPNFSKFDEEVERWGIQNNITYNGYRELEDVLRHLLKADLGLAITKPSERSHTPAKIFDYMACDLPILGIDSPGGSMQSILKEFKNAKTVSHGSVDDIYSALDYFYTERPIRLDSEWEKVLKYSNESNSKKLEELIQSKLK